MIGALAGGEGLEIIVALKDLTAKGFEHVRGEMSKTEAAANSTNLGGFSKAAKTAEKDAESAAGKGGGGISGLASGLLGLAGGPVTLAVVGIGALALGAIKLTETWDHIESQEKTLDAAFKAHGSSLEANRSNLDKLVTSNEQYGRGADETRAAVTELAQAGHPWSDIVKSMPAILDLARAKHIDLGAAAKAVELAEMGNGKALKDLGIILPKTGIYTKDLATAQAALAKASQASTSAHNGLTKASEAVSLAHLHLHTVEEALKNKHHLTAAEALQLRTAHDRVTTADLALQAAHGRVNTAATALKTAQTNLSTAMAGGSDKAGRQAAVLKALEGQVGGSRNATTSMEVAQAKLSDAWQRAATVVGPALEAIFSALIDVTASLLTGVVDILGPIGDLWGWFTKLPAPIQFLFGPIGVLISGWTHVAGVVGTVIDAIRNLLGILGQAANAIANSPIGSVGGIVGKATGAIGGLLNMIPHFAGGGAVEPRNGGTLALLGEAGEREWVIPESRLSRIAGAGGGRGGTTNISVHFHLPVVPTHEQARLIVDAIEPELARRLSQPGTAGYGYGGF